MKVCPACGSRVIETFALRPDNWPVRQQYHACESCMWEEQDMVKSTAEKVKAVPRVALAKARLPSSNDGE